MQLLSYFGTARQWYLVLQLDLVCVRAPELMNVLCMYDTPNMFPEL